MRWLITGAGGALGHDLTALLSGETVTAATRADLDITDVDAVRAAVSGHDVVVNTAAYTAVDDAETDEATATRVNGYGPEVLASACAAAGARLLQVSTDYVLPGDATRPCPEDAATDPVNAYGRSKLVGEQAVLGLLPDTGYVVRTAWLYGETGTNFVATMLKLAASRPTVSVVNDQHGQPTWTFALAEQLVTLGRADAAPGIYHGTASGETTWHGLTQEIYRLAGLDPDRVGTTTSDAFPRPAKRPAYSVLGHDRWAAAGLPVQPHWRDQLASALERPSFVELVEKARAAA
ncbi:dTDP-4-dehydrorhamnose reductase [Cryptosporangium phraense]|uniref:dTDP-4-dehydrorhamnose reductase n=1 Tax=Cryptosporangium phraense TaxID=2593070 RepID=A0A545AZK3_9ACTN|nr:dTDP-4-dehydrorhamnose reductase [Cryptosporangium phraense]TQS46773.1 dTDP-4-dehydrorhamnose reductase [Cryptosporangium phraense]